MFEPFVRGDSSRSSETGGAGLGLSIARQIIRAHGGAIDMANLKTRGLRVSIVLPRGREGEENAAGQEKNSL